MPPELTLRISSLQQDLDWERTILGLPGVHILQSSAWAQIKQAAGWQAEYLVWLDTEGRPAAASLVLSRPIPLLGRLTGSRVLYCPRGPLLDWEKSDLALKVLGDLKLYAFARKAVWLKIDPDLPVGAGLPGSPDFTPVEPGASLSAMLRREKWRPSPDQVQFRNTVLLDLSRSEDDLLAAMKQKTRYNISLAARKGVTVRPGTKGDLPGLYRLYAQTALRDGFAIRDEKYYLTVWNHLLDQGIALPLLAEAEGEVVAGLVLFLYAGRGYYFYGMSSHLHRDRMPNYLLQWEAIRQAKAAGCSVYDLWGAPDSYDPADPMWGVYRFKEGFTGRTVAGLGAWDLVLDPIQNRLVQIVAPRLLSIMRRLGRRRLSQELLA